MCGQLINKRINRVTHIAMYSVMLALASLASFIVGGLEFHYVNNGVDIMFIVAAVILTPSVIVISIMRLHDLNFSGWWVLSFVVPLLGLIVWLALFFVPGTEGKNRFGNYMDKTPLSTYALILTLPVVFGIMMLCKHFYSYLVTLY